MWYFFIIFDKTDHCHYPFKIKCEFGIKCISPHQICDGFEDCQQGTDEKMCKGKNNSIARQKCDSNINFKCNKKHCIPIYQYCDGVADCKDKSDEKSCGKILNIIYKFD